MKHQSRIAPSKTVSSPSALAPALNPLKLLLFCAAATLLLAGKAQAGNYYQWYGTGGNALWSTEGNWTGAGTNGTAIMGGTTAYVTFATTTGSTNDNVDLTASGTASYVFFGSATSNADAYTIGTGLTQTLTLTAAASANLLVYAGVTQNETINANLSLTNPNPTNPTGNANPNAINVIQDASTTNNESLTIAGNVTFPATTGTLYLETTFGVVNEVFEANSLIFNGSIGGPNITLYAYDVGTVVLNGSNSYGGGTLLNGGLVVVGNSNALSSGTVFFAGAGGLANNSGNPITIANPFLVTANTAAPGIVVSGSNPLTFSGVITGTSATVLPAFIIDNPSVTVNQAFTGSLGLTMEGTGKLILNGANTYTGATTVDAGTLQVGDGSSGGISSSTALTVVAGTFELYGNSSGLTSQTVNKVTLGTSSLGGASSIVLATGGGAGTTFAMGNITAYANTSVDFTIPANCNVTTTSANTNGILAGWATVGGTTWATGTGSASPYNVVPFTAFNQTNNFGDVSTTNNDIITQSGTLTASNSLNSLVFATNGTLSTTNGGVNFNYTLDSTYGGLLVTGTGGAIVGSGTVGAGPKNEFIVNTAPNASLTIASTLIGSGSSGSLLKTGAGTLTLTGANSYTGATTIIGGTLALGGGGSLTASTINLGENIGIGILPTVACANNGTLLIQGNYTIGAASAGGLTMNGGTLSLVDGSINTLTFASTTADAFNINNNTSMGTAVDMEVGNGSADRINVSGTIAIGACPMALNLTGLGGLTGGTQTLISTTGEANWHQSANMGKGGLSNFYLGTATGNFSGYTLALASDTTMHLWVIETPNATPTAAYWNGAAAAAGGTNAWSSFVGGNTNTSNFISGSNGIGANCSGAPGPNTNVFFDNGITGGTGTVLGGNLTINSLTLSASNAVTIGGANALTIMATGANGNTAGGIMVPTKAASDTIGSNIVLGNSQTWTVTDPGNTLSVSGGIIDSGSGYSLTKMGAGTLALSGTSSFGGGTQVSAGTVVVSGSLGGAVTVNNTGFLAGRGILGGNVTVNNGGNMATTTALTGSNAGILTIGNLTMSGALSTLSMQINGAATAGSTYDQLVTNGLSANTLNGTLALTLGRNVSINDVYTLVLGNSNSSAASLTTLFSNLTVSGPGAGTGLAYYSITDPTTFLTTDYWADSNFSYTFGDAQQIAGGSFDDLTLTIGAGVPEPSVWASLFAGMGLLALGRRVRRHRLLR